MSKKNLTAKGDRVELKFVRMMAHYGWRSEKARVSKGMFDRVFTRCKVHRGQSAWPTEGPCDGTCGYEQEVRNVQIKGLASRKSGWSMCQKDIDRMRTARLLPGETRERWRHIDHPGRPCTPRLHMDAQLMLQDGSWQNIPIIPDSEAALDPEGPYGLPYEAMGPRQDSVAPPAPREAIRHKASRTKSGLPLR